MGLLIAGLPQESRYAARIQGYDGGRGWTDQDFLRLDLRNAVEALRVMYASQGKKKAKYREWDSFPGQRALKRRERAKRFDSYRKMLSDNRGRVELS